MARRKRAFTLSKQAPPSMRRRVRRVLMWAGIVLGVCIFAGVVGIIYFLSWLQGDGFRRHLEQQIKQATHARSVSVPEPLNMNGRHFTLPSLTVQQVGLIHELSISKLHLEADRPALLRRILRMQHFSTEVLQITLQAAGSQTTAPLPLSNLQTTTGNGLFKSITARSFESHYTDTTLLLQEGKKISLVGYHLTAKPGQSGWLLRAENGRIITPFTWLRESGVKKASLHYQGDTLRLSDCRVLLTPGYLQLKGDMNIATGSWQARADINRADVARILSQDWRKRLTGELSGYMDMAGSTGGSWQAHGELHLSKGVLEGLPILSSLRLRDTYPYRHLDLEQASCRLTYPYTDPQHHVSHAWLWDNIDIRAQEGALLIRGRVIVGQDSSLSGALTFGIPARVLADMGIANTPLVQQIFNAPAAVPGYVWVHVNLSGTLDAPQEDLSVRLATILPDTLPSLQEQAVESLQSVLGRFLPAAKQPASAESPAAPAESTAPPVPTPAKGVQQIINTGFQLLR